jgi:hypothetical protein
VNRHFPVIRIALLLCAIPLAAAVVLLATNGYIAGQKSCRLDRIWEFPIEER